MTNKWRKGDLTALKALYSGENIAATHRSLVSRPPSTRKPKSSQESERRAQQRVVQWLYEKRVPFFSVPNGANVSMANRMTLLSEGLQAGVPDLVIVCARGGYHGLFVEMKREDGGAGLSDDQKKWLKILQEEGYHAIQCNGYDRALEAIEWYLGLKDFSVSFMDIISSIVSLWLPIGRRGV